MVISQSIPGMNFSSWSLQQSSLLDFNKEMSNLEERELSRTLSKKRQPKWSPLDPEAALKLSFMYMAFKQD